MTGKRGEEKKNQRLKVTGGGGGFIGERPNNSSNFLLPGFLQWSVFLYRYLFVPLCKSLSNTFSIYHLYCSKTLHISSSSRSVHSFFS